MGDPICAAERSEDTVGLGAAVRRVFRASKKNRSEAEGLSEKPVAGSLGKLHPSRMLRRGRDLEEELERQNLALQVHWRKAGKIAAIVTIEFIENAARPTSR